MSDYVEEKAPVTSDSRPRERPNDLLSNESPGVQRIEAIAAHITFQNRVAIFASVFLIAYAYSLDGTVRYVFQVRHCLRYPSAVN